MVKPEFLNPPPFPPNAGDAPVPFFGMMVIGDDHIIEHSTDFHFTNITHSKEELIGFDVRKYFRELETIPLEQIMEYVIQTGRSFHYYEYEILPVPGLPKATFLNINFQPLPFASPLKKRVLVLFHDVTHQVEARKTIEENERKLRSLANAMPHLVWIADPDGRVTYYNERISEYSGADKNGDNWEWSPMIHPDDLDDTFAAWRNAQITKTLYSKEHRICKVDGTYRWHVSKAHPLLDKHGEIVKWYGTATDIHDEKLTEQKLLEQEERIRLALHSAELGTFDYHFSLNVMICSERAVELMNLSVHPPCSLQEFFKHIHQEDKAWVIDWFSSIHHRPEHEPLEIEFSVLCNDGKNRTVRLKGKVVHDVLEGSDRLLGTLMDITEHREVERLMHVYTRELEEKVEERTRSLQLTNSRLQKANEELEQFAYVTSHDLQEPLRKIETFTKLLGELEHPDETARRYMDKITHPTRRMSTLINDVLNYSKIVDHAEHIVAVDLNEIVRQVLSDYELTISEKNATVAYADLPVIEAVPFQMNQLFSNLIGNALKFSRPGACQISVSSTRLTLKELVKHPDLSPDLAYYKIEVKDNGIGFDQQYAEKIFSMFQRLNARDIYDGSGIGLSMSKKIVQNHRGKIYAEGSEDVGSTFIVILPEARPVNDYT